MEFDPQAAAVKCPYCGHENHIPQSEADIQELDYNAYLGQLASGDDVVEATLVKCESCGAETTLRPNIVSDECPFCGSAIVAQAKSRKVIKPRSLLPFHITRQQALEGFQSWLRGLWFAPGALKTYARTESTHFQGIYVPYWTYDCFTITFYRGQRGENYTVTRTYTVRVGNRNETRTRHETRTRWYSASGVVNDSFDDILISASRSLPRHLEVKLEPWDLENLTPFDEGFLAGYKAESYQVELPAGFEEAKAVMDAYIRRHVRRDIGGDKQRIHHMAVEYNNITFKHILLPIWISSYRFRDKVYHFLVNARTGEVHGDRPWSFWKILGLILLILTIIGAIGGVIALLSATN